MPTVTYESLKAEQAWMVVSDQLNQRNTLLSRGISHLERQATELPLASRLMILRYHLRHSLRKMTGDARRLPRNSDEADAISQQWMHIHQLHFLLRQIDAELENASEDSDAFRDWLESMESRVYKSALVTLN
ncbi:hypothetical protein F5984_15915 [Rudanella paleaurantiibacter]|uniref:Uncharacterized protein n=1 Tax=Rudanella paleaurantiibacter TaxID=2614655 RepID=A0A7J5TXI2_9BACT|nr:hypothetical protein [Rudanella paleaurantiibacter]KAB7729133.1 hypothetical protein F5984_15915 [Rudanella paleaurantiibacter]